MDVPARGDDRLRAALASRPTLAGLLVGLLFWWRSLYPTLMPRTWVAQAAMSALCVAIGVGLGTLAGAIGQRLLVATGHDVSPRVKAIAWRAALVVGVVAVVAGAVVWPRWQTQQRRGVSLDSLPAVQALPMLVVGLVLTALFVTIGRLIGRAVRRLHRFADRHLPRFVATAATVVVVAVVGVFLVRDVLVGGSLSRVAGSFTVVDAGTTEGTVAPTDPAVSGSPRSLVPWNSLGLQGRDFVAQATSPAALAAFAGPDAPVQHPIRVYVGLGSADTSQARADLAVRELERTDAFQRAVLVVITVTGSGWVDPDAAVAIEQMYGGDTALVAQQYSNLPSWVATLADPDAPADAGVTLFETVRARWLREPADTRPKLLVFGQSLGSYGAEAAFAGPDARTSVANLVAKTEGALFTGPTNDNPVWGQLTEGRDAGSPVWRPVYDGGRHVRFANRDPEVGPPEVPWSGSRILYIQHPTDPVTFWSPDSLWSPPEWMDDPRGIAVPTRGRWFPIVTGLQGVFDLMAGFGAPPGYGHDYRLDFVAGWAQVAPPPGWDASRTAALETFLRQG